jgi:hypothetical protein
MFGQKTLTSTLTKVTSFIQELEEGINGNDTAAAGKKKAIEAIESEVFTLNAETAVAKKLLAKLQ